MLEQLERRGGMSGESAVLALLHRISPSWPAHQGAGARARRAAAPERRDARGGRARRRCVLRPCPRRTRRAARAQERRERHRQNYMHITIHTSQTWADTFISELNDTHVEAELRTKHIPPQARPRRAARRRPAFVRRGSVQPAQRGAMRRPFPGPFTPRAGCPPLRCQALRSAPCVRGRARMTAASGAAAGHRGGGARVPRRAPAPAGAGLQRDADDRRGGPAAAQAPL